MIYLALDRINRSIEQAVPPVGPNCRRRRSRARPRGCSNGIDLSGAVHPPAGRHHAAGDRAVPGRRRRLRVPSRGLGPERRLSRRSASTRQPAGRRSVGHGRDRRRAAGTAARRNLRHRPDHLDRARSAAPASSCSSTSAATSTGAARDVQAAINASLADLPSDLPTLPTFRKANTAAAPVFVLALTSKTHVRQRASTTSPTR